MNKAKKESFKKAAIHVIFIKVTAKLYKRINISTNDK